MSRARRPEAFKPVEQLLVLLDLEGGSRLVGTLAWSRAERRSYFQYHRDFLADPLPLSPFKLPLRAEARPAGYAPFDGLHGLFNDSLPDGWGRRLTDRLLQKLGVDFRALTPLDRLSLIGGRGMGALRYDPDRSHGARRQGPIDLARMAEQAERVEREVEAADIELLSDTQGGSSGARPKIVVGLNPETLRIRADPGHLPDGFEPWLVKFRSIDDPKEIASEEFAYALMAAAADVEVPDTRLLAASRGKKFFAAKRFDRSPTGRHHVHTVSGLLELDHRAPSLDYDGLLKVTRALTRDERAVRQMFRRMVFNVLARNRDDHAKNHAFRMLADGTWLPTPAYDLTLSNGPGGEHNLTVAGEGRNPGLPDILKVAANAMIPVAEANSIHDRTRSAIDRWPEHAERAGLSRRRIAEIDALLNGPRLPSGKRRNKNPKGGRMASRPASS